MRTPTKTTAIVLTGAVALASGAYALGSQAGDGAATAHDGERRGAPRGDGECRGLRGPGPRLEGLAQRLGVSIDQLRAALEDLRAQRPGREEMDKRRAEHAAALARELDVSRADLRAALRKLRESARARHEARRNEFAAQLAERLSLPAERVREALPAFGPHHGRRGP